MIRPPLALVVALLLAMPSVRAQSPSPRPQVGRAAEQQQTGQKEKRSEDIHSPASGSKSNPASNDEGRNSKNDPGYWRQVFAPGNLPSILLAVVGMFGILMALKTIGAIHDQTREVARAATATERSANAAQVSAEAIRILNRQSVDISGWSVALEPISSLASLGLKDAGVVSWQTRIGFTLTNHTNWPLTLAFVQAHILDLTAQPDDVAMTGWTKQRIDSPLGAYAQQRHRVSIVRPIDKSRKQDIERTDISFNIAGYVVFTDHFGQEDRTPFVRTCYYFRNQEPQVADFWGSVNDYLRGLPPYDESEETQD